MDVVVDSGSLARQARLEHQIRRALLRLVMTKVNFNTSPCDVTISWSTPLPTSTSYRSQLILQAMTVRPAQATHCLQTADRDLHLSSSACSALYEVT